MQLRAVAAARCHYTFVLLLLTSASAPDFLQVNDDCVFCEIEYAWKMPHLTMQLGKDAGGRETRLGADNQDRKSLPLFRCVAHSVD